MYYINIEIINTFKIYFIVIVVTRNQSLTRNAADILVLNSNHDLYFFLAMMSKHKIDFEIRSESNISINQPGKIIAYFT